MAASAAASSTLGREPTLKHAVIVSQVRSITVDLLRAIGVEREQASARLRSAGWPAGSGSRAARRATPSDMR